MIYLDSSVALAYLLAEERRPPQSFWEQPFISSRLLQYEVWTRVHARGLAGSLVDSLRFLFERIAFVEMIPPVLTRALEPFPTPVRTLDALHLASVAFLQSQGQPVEIASYDDRLVTVARQLGFPIADA